MSLDSMEHIKKSTNHTFLQIIEQIFKTTNNKKTKILSYTCIIWNQHFY